MSFRKINTQKQKLVSTFMERNRKKKEPYPSDSIELTIPVFSTLKMKAEEDPGKQRITWFKKQ